MNARHGLGRKLASRRDARRSVAGFTLVEILVAMVLMGMILAALATVTAQWLPSWSYGFARLQRSELVAIGIDRIARDLASAEFISVNRKSDKPFFDGNELSVLFVRSAINPNARGGLAFVRIAESGDQHGPLVIRTSAPFTPRDDASAQLSFSDPVVLLRTPYSLSFSYAGKDRVWKSEWRDERLMPSAVRLTVRDAATHVALASSTVVVVHADMPAACSGDKGGEVCSDRAENSINTSSDHPSDNEARSQ